MPYITGGIEQVDGKTFTRYTNFSYGIEQTYIYQVAQDAVSIINPSDQILTVNVNGISTTIQPGREATFGNIRQFSVQSSSYEMFTAESWVTTGDITAQLAETATQLADIGQPTANRQGAIISIIDDDGYATFLDRWKIVCDSQGIKVSLAVQTGVVGDATHLSISQLAVLKSQGFELLSHSVTHPDPATLTDAQWETELSDSQSFIINNGLGDGRSIVYPAGLGNVSTTQRKIELKALVRKYYRYGIDASGGNNLLPVDNYQVKRYQINFTTTTLADIQLTIDAANASNGWLVILTHSNATWDAVKANAFIDYAQGLNIPFMTFGDAEKLVGNTIANGDSLSSEYCFVGKNGKVNLSGITTSTGTFNVDDPATAYTQYKTTRRQITNLQETYFNKGGVLETYRGSNAFSYQLLFQAGTNYVYKRTWDDTNSVWRTWSRIDSNTTYRLVSVNVGVVAANTTKDVTVPSSLFHTGYSCVANPNFVLPIGIMYNAWTSAEGTITLRVYNTTAASIDCGINPWIFKSFDNT